MDSDDIVALRRTKDAMDRYFAEPLDVPTLANSCHMSVGHYQRSFKKAFGESPYSYLLTRRVERACYLLRQPGACVTNVCMDVGFTSLGSFSAKFSEIRGMSPSTYRDTHARTDNVIPACFLKHGARPTRG